MITNKFKFMVVVFAALAIAGCKGADGDNGTTGADGAIFIKLTVDSSFTAANTGSGTKANWACVVLSSSKTGCIYYYNGVEQLDGSISDAAASAGPGTSSEYTFVTSGTTFSGYAAGSRTYSIQLYTSTTDSAVRSLSGTVNLSANAGTAGTAGGSGSIPMKDGDDGVNGADGADKLWALNFSDGDSISAPTTSSTDL